MRYTFLVVLFGCETFDESSCEYPGDEDIIPELISESCVEVTLGCSADALQCTGFYDLNNQRYYITWIHHLNRDIPCDAEGCENAWNWVDDWCKQKTECWREDHMPELEYCDASHC